MYNVNGSPTLVNCTFEGNLAVVGGGVDNSDGNPTLIGCNFRGNIALGACGLGCNAGGGMFAYGSATLIDCVFNENWGIVGGGIQAYAKLTLIDCRLAGNSSG